ncbi:MAG: hypothetical protein ACI39R_07440 [Lachnospiraceae bacterium]
MKNRVKFRIARDLCVHEGKGFVLSIFLLAVTMFLIGYLAYTQYSLNDYRKRAETGLKVSAEQIGTILVEDTDRYDEFVDALNNVNGVMGIGTMESNQFFFVKDLAFLGNLQKGHFKGITDQEYENEYEGCFQTTIVGAGIWQAMNIDLQEGKAPTEYDINERTWLLYLSEEFKDAVTMGEQYYSYDREGNVLAEYLIAGFYSSSTRMMDERVLLQKTSDSVGFYMPEYSVIVVDSGKQDGMFVCEKGKYDEVVKNFYTLAEQYSADISVYSMDAIVSKAEKNDSKVADSFAELSMLLGISALVMVICSQTITLLSHTRDFGVWLSSGATKKDLVYAFWFQNSIRTIAALPVAGAVLLFLLRQEAVDVETDALAKSIYLGVSVPVMIVCGIVMIIISSLIPLMILKKTPVTTMLAGETE